MPPWVLLALAAAAAALLFSNKGEATNGIVPVPPAGGTGPKPPPGSAPTIKPGAQGPWVAYLASLLGIPVSTNMAYGGPLEAAVRAFQAAHGLTVDGIIGPMTWGALGVTQAPKASTPTKTAPSTQVVTPTFLGANPAGGSFGDELSDNLVTREEQMISAVDQGRTAIDWVQVKSEKNGRTCIFLMMRQALRIGFQGDEFLVSASFNATQRMADILGVFMPTTRMLDLFYQQSQVKLPSMNQTSWQQDGTMGRTERMREYAAMIETKIAASSNPSGTIGNEGKAWVITRRNWTPPQGIADNSKGEGQLGSPHNGANFGWYTGKTKQPGPGASPGGMEVLQSIGLAHDRHHADYSQLIYFVQPDCFVDGVKTNVEAVLADPERSFLLQDEGGTIPKLRHPDL